MSDEFGELNKNLPVLLLSILGLLAINFEAIKGVGFFVFGTIALFGIPAWIYYLIRTLSKKKRG